MQVTIDSAEPLERVLPVVAALYGVELTVTPREAVAGQARPASPAPKTGRSRRGRNAKQDAPAGTGRRRARRAGGAKPDPVVVRRWARANKFAVKDFGRVPAAVTAAYLEDGAPAS
jgi:hypothetical protein